MNATGKIGFAKGSSIYKVKIENFPEGNIHCFLNYRYAMF